MKTILISSFTNEAASRSKGEILREYIDETIKTGDEITVDFSGINKFASPFFNNSFASLALLYGFDKIEQIKLHGITETGMHTYEISIENAKMLATDPIFADKMNQIIQEAPKNTEE